MHEIERFIAKTEVGTFVTQIVVYDMTDDDAFNACFAAEGARSREARTPSGFRCTRVDDDTWRIDDLGVTVRRVR